MNRLMLIILVCMLLAGCTRQQHVSKHFVILVDTSGSIEPDAETACMKSIGKLVEGMERGDTLSVIPITGDADIESTGRVLRFQKPTERAAYDADLVSFSKQAQKSLADFQAWALAHPARKTDIFGGVRMAEEEVGAAPKGQRNVLIIFTDFIQEDGNVDFNSDRRLRTKEAAIQYAATEAKMSFPTEHAFSQVHLALLRSKELHALDRQRREAIKQFWLEYFRAQGVRPGYMTDGVGLIATDS
jgi:hypothetical protein